MTGQRGPKGLPANVHMLQGNRSKKNMADLLNEVRPPVSIPTPPEHLLDEAKAEWDRITAQLEPLGLVTEIDMAVLAAYCQAFARWCRAESQLKALGDAALIEVTPNKFKQQSALLLIANRAEERMLKLATEFGMTPAARARVSPSNPQGDLFGFGSEGKQAPKGPGRFFKD